MDNSGARTGDLTRLFADAPLWRSAFLLLPVVLGWSVMLDAMAEVIRTVWRHGSVAPFVIHGVSACFGAFVAAALIRSHARTQSVAPTKPAV